MFKSCRLLEETVSVNVGQLVGPRPSLIASLTKSNGQYGVDLLAAASLLTFVTTLHCNKQIASAFLSSSIVLMELTNFWSST